MAYIRNKVCAFFICQIFAKIFRIMLDIPLAIVLSYTVHYCGALRSFRSFLLWKGVVSPTLSCGWDRFLSGAESFEKKYFEAICSGENIKKCVNILFCVGNIKKREVKRQWRKTEYVRSKPARACV